MYSSSDYNHMQLAGYVNSSILDVWISGTVK